MCEPSFDALPSTPRPTGTPARRIAEHDEVMECYLMTGDSDYLIRVAVADIGALEKFILEQLTPIAGIEKIRSSFALKQVRYKTALPLPKG